MTRRNQYIYGAGFIAPLWLIASLMLMMRLVAAEDTGLPIGEIATHVDGQETVSMDPNYTGEHQGEFPPVPSWLKTVNVIAMPVAYILPADGFNALPDDFNGSIFLSAMFISSVLWGLLVVFIFRLVATQFRLITMAHQTA